MITIITVCYNAEKQVENTLKSVLEQTYPDIEYIIQDGCSTDKTLSLVKETINQYPQRKVVIHSEPDSGIYNAMNKALQYATGEWVLFMNVGDTFYNRQVLSSVFNGRENTSATVIYGNSNLVFPFGCSIKEPVQPLQFKGALPFVHQSAFVRTAVMRQYGFNEHYKVLADLHFFKTIYEQGCLFEKVDAVISNYEIGGFSEKNMNRMFHENEDIQGTKCSLGYYCRLLKHTARLTVFKCTPYSVINRIRQRRYAVNNCN